MKKLIASAVLSGVVLVPAAAFAPAAVADEGTAPAVSSASEAQEQLERVNASIDEVTQAKEAAEAATQPDVDYIQELREVLETALEMRESLEAIATGRIPDMDVATIGPRIELLTSISNTIETASTDLSTKVSEAHVELGFSVTKAVIRLINPTATVAQIEESTQDLADTLAKVSEYPELQPGDRATIYVKAELDRAIWDVRIQRDQNILGEDADAYFTLNGKISEAVGVQLDPTATVAETQQAVEDVRAAYAEAEGQVR